jgi:hypothetical membrane protein
LPLRLSTRFKIVGWEFVFLGAFLLAIVGLQLEEPDTLVGSFAWVYGIIGVTGILVGLETVSLVRQLPTEPKQPEG